MRRLVMASCIFAVSLMVAQAVLVALSQAPPAATAAPFTALETARLDALSQEGRALDAEQRTLTLLRERWQGKVAAFKAAAEQDRPGWTWNAETGQWSEVKK